MRGRRGGFTLIELLVVVAVIALLVSILLPSLTNARKQAEAVVCASDLRQVLLGIYMYQTDAKGTVPGSMGPLPGTLWSEYDWNHTDPEARKHNLWFYKLCDPPRGKKYIGDPKVFLCPGDPHKDKFNYEAAHPSPLAPYPHMLVSAQSCGYGLTYVIRHWGVWNIEKQGPKRPANTILMAEVGPDTALKAAPLMQGSGRPWRDGGRIIWDDGKRGWYNGPTWLTARHLGKINVAAMDLAVHRVRTSEMLRAPIQKQYPDCKAGECYFCNYHQQYGDATHYNFAHAKLYWWTGRFPS